MIDLPHAGRRRLLGAAAGVAFVGFAARTRAATPDPLPVFDVHLHYSHDAWERFPPAAVLALMREAGLKRALVSSSGDEGTQRLVAAAPDLVLPVLRPYRTRAEVSTWTRDDTVIRHMEERLGRYRYVALGEYHVYGADADLPVVRRVVQMARERRLFLHSHSDAEAVERQFAQDAQARILWAHAGFDRPSRVGAMLRRYPRLWCDLAFRSDHATVGLQSASVEPEWRALFLEFPERFMVGTDTYTPERWHYVVEHARWSRRWLAELPAAVAEAIAWRNAETLFGSALGAPGR